MEYSSNEGHPANRRMLLGLRASTAQFLLHSIERVVWLLREGDSDFVAWSDNSGLQHNCHNSGFANYSPFVIVSHHRLQKSRFECIDLSTRISQSGDFDQSVRADLESGTSGQG